MAEEKSDDDMTPEERLAWLRDHVSFNNVPLPLIPYRMLDRKTGSKLEEKNTTHTVCL
jgi:hypothetical protein